MAQNIFDATFDANNRIDVNSFDWSHVNNLTTNFGRITPVFCELVPAKGSLRINPERVGAEKLQTKLNEEASGEIVTEVVDSTNENTVLLTVLIAFADTPF